MIKPLNHVGGRSRDRQSTSLTSFLGMSLLSALLLLSSGSYVAADERIRIGAEDDWYPFSALRDEHIQGMSVDIVRAAFAAGGAQIELQSYPYTRCMQLSLKGVLAGCFNTTPTASTRAQYLLPEEPLFSDDIVLWARKDYPLASITPTQLAGHSIAVTSGYEYGTGFDSDTRFKRVFVRRDLHGFRMVEHNRVDFVVAFRTVAHSLFREYNDLTDEFKPLLIVARPKLYLSFSRVNPHSPTLIQQFDRGMRAIRADGRYLQILDHWQHTQSADQPAPNYTTGKHGKADAR